jgi:uncharacterized protein YrrD
MARNRITKGSLAAFLSLLALLVVYCPVGNAQPPAPEERQILINPDFSQAPVGANPPGWFRAMMPNLTQGLNAGVYKDESGPYLFLEQKGVTGNLFNNWAQRIEKPPVGAKLRLEAEVSTRDATGKGAVVMVMFFDKGGNIVGAISSEGQVDLTGTKTWTKINLEGTVPSNTDLAIARLGLSAGAGTLYARYARVYVVGEKAGQMPATTPAVQMEAGKGKQILINPDFSQGLVMGNPPGWFRAMMPKLTQGMNAGINKDEGGPYLFLEQKGVTGNLFNNWAQRIENPPVGAKLRLEAEVSTRDATGKGGVLMVMFFDKGGSVVGAMSSEGQVDLTGTKPWTKINLEGDVPANTDVAIVRLGLSPGSGMLVVRYARLYEL